MLLSPGHSPLHLSSPSPSTAPTPSSSFPDGSVSKSEDSSLITPRIIQKKNTVLDEDVYVSAIEKIIERDFFPDISKLRDRLDWLEAVKTRDPIQIRDAQLKIMERRGMKVNNLNPRGRTHSRTPGSTFMRNFTPADEFDGKTPTNFTPGASTMEASAGVDSSEGTDGIETSYSLDEFFRRYTSEDNDSFSNILEKVNRKRKERCDYLLGSEKGEAELLEDAKRDRITDGYGTSYQPPSTLEGWNYTAKNLLMYHPADRGEVPLTLEERVVRLKCLTREINRSNTRFHGKIMENGPRDDGTVEVLYNPIAGSTPFQVSRDSDKAKKYDLEDFKKTPNPFYVESGKKSENQYSYVQTPSPAPGVDESPFITWGEVEGTPLRLDLDDETLEIGGSADGPRFKMPNPPARDVKAHSLSREAARKVRLRSKMFQKPPLPRSGSASPSARTFSPAAQKFMRNAIAKSSNSSAIDETLRASYRGSSPGSATPKSLRSLSRFGRDDGSVDSRSPSVREEGALL